MAMYIVAGKHKGRRIESPEGRNVRPTAARTREAVFNILSHGRFAEKELLGSIDERTAMFVLTAGTTLTGAIEHVTPAVATQLARYQVPIHVDAAYGGFNCGLLPNTDRDRQQLTEVLALPTVRSITIDPHKFVGPIGCSMLLTTNNTTSAEERYLPGSTRYTGTTRGALIPALTLATIEGNGLTELQRKAVANKYGARCLAHYLKQYGLEVWSVHAGLVAIKMPSFVAAQKAHHKLEEFGLHIPAPFKINGEYGIRILLSPEYSYDIKDQAELALLISYLIRS